MQQELVAGDSLSFTTAGGDYPASAGWVLQYRLIPRTVGNSAIEITSSASGDDHLVAVAASVTAGWAPDSYTWASKVDRVGEIYTVETGQIVVKPNPWSVSAGYDGRSQARKAVEDLRSALAAWSPIQRRYKIGEREMEFNSSAEIIKLLTWWEQQVAAEERLAGRATQPSRRIFSRI